MEYIPYIILVFICSAGTGYMFHRLYLRIGGKRRIDDGRSPRHRLSDKDSELRNRLLFQLISSGNLFGRELIPVLQKITETVARMISCERISVWQYNDDYSVLHCLDLYTLSNDKHSSGEELASSKFPSYMKAHMTELLIAATDVFTDPRTKEIPASYLKKNRITSLLDTPLWRNNKIAGVLSFEQTGTKRIWSRDDERISMIIAAMISLCFETYNRTIAEKQLQDTEQQLKTIGNSLAAGMIFRIVCGKDGSRKFSFVSSGVYNIHGLTPRQIIENSALLYRQISHEDIDIMKEKEQQALLNMTPFDVETKIINTKGEKRWIRIISSPTQIKNEEVTFDGIEIDITDRKLAEEHFSSAFHKNPCPMSITEADTGLILEVNNAWLNTFEYNREDINGKTTAELQVFANAAEQEKVVSILTGKGKVSDLELDLVTRTGRRIKGLFFADLVETAGTNVVLATMLDMTEQYRLKQESVQNALSFKAIFEASPYSIAINRVSDGTYVKVNPAFEKITGYTEEEILGRHGNNLTLRQNKAEAESFAKQLMATGRVDNALIKTLTKSGEERYTMFSTRIIDFNAERCFLSLTIDMTETRRIQNQLFQAQKMDAIGQLAGGVAHDFNNMLGGIMGSVELLQLNLDNPQKRDKYLGLIKTTTERAAELAAKLLAFSRKSDIELIPVDIHKIIEDTYELLSHTINKKINIDLNLQAERSIVRGDMSQMMNIFLNLGINAGHAMPDGGELTFLTRTAELDETWCRINSPDLKPGPYIIIEVRDTGYGIPQESIGQLFDPFFTTSEKGKGTGLGLSVVYGNIKQHNGTITVYSEQGRGTLFHVYIPLADDDIPLTAKSNELISGSGVVLVVDDEEMMRLTAREILQYLGYEVLEAVNGKDGLDLFIKEHDRIDAVLLDMVMPVMNGHECFIEMKKIDPAVKVIISSGFILDHNLDEMKQGGLMGFIRKPYQSADLSRILAEVLLHNDRCPGSDPAPY